ncbi:hypothetical protein LMH87_006860 [Akanthomyces muscarius]|uniref:Uncharacterized protein n=1 Tax=Akanthomyces muscarius TaxID=2231603 RepID=A0A9W8UTK8_AKAMU|nr:hypothetical protein LMH87_006860 [Akanthomyces muscarius]KAJ4165219.1 hypothetical protein LMH87_006860 [Akanthomyces muscarius]
MVMGKHLFVKSARHGLRLSQSRMRVPLGVVNDPLGQAAIRRGRGSSWVTCFLFTHSAGQRQKASVVQSCGTS